MSSRHPRLRILPDNLFRGLSSFRELEQRIADLPEELHRGDAFEVFVEGYLWTTTVWQVEDLWLVGQVPLDVRRELNLPADAKGIDGVFRTRAGGLVPYQVKYRIDRPHVGVTEVATFLGLTDRATDRVLISNADRFAPDVEIRDYLRLLRGADFDALTSDDFATIEGWLDHRPVTHRHATPFPHQRAALADIASTLTVHDRTTVVMACGTGKTLVGLWTAEQQSPQTVLVLVPSLALLSQALGDWSRETSWGDRFEYLCVCSDPSVSAEQDATQVRSTDVSFHVDTDPAVVRRFLDRPSTGSVRVVFSTYQSAPIVAAGMSIGGAFDLGVFDEAHKTTGLRDGVFGFALDDARIRIRKRVFFTATPRHVDIRHRDNEGDFRVASMDDPAVYGPRAHTLNFADAVAQGLICDYHVVVSVVSPAEVTAFALAHGITLVKGDKQGTQWVATQIAVSKAIAETAAKKVITFHSRINQAKEFASPTPRGIGQYLDGFVVDHVNGTLRVAERKDILSGFKNDQKRLVTNARCLTEGVDLPAVDMVVFSNPRKSRLDIIQAVGRAMRKPRNGTKTLGYVVVPILLAPHEAENLEAASRDTDWEDIVDVLVALREHDTRLENLIRDAQIAKGRGEVFNPRAFSEVAQVVGPLVLLEDLERHIGTVVLKSLGVPWDVRFGQLTAFADANGHCNVPSEQWALSSWLSEQRQLRRRGKLPAERATRLEEVGVIWEGVRRTLREGAWERRFSELLLFKSREGSCNVWGSDRKNRLLASWVTSQRTQFRSGQLSLERKARLEGIGFVWDVSEAIWDDRYRSVAGLSRGPNGRDFSESLVTDPTLDLWLSRQKRAARLGLLSAARIAQLEALGLVWNAAEASAGEGQALSSLEVAWETRYQELVAFKNQHGHCDVPSGDLEHGPLARWLSSHRQMQRRKYLSDTHRHRIARLETLGVVWGPRIVVRKPRIVVREPKALSSREVAWETRYQELVAFKNQHGHCDVPSGDLEHGPLARWLSSHRKRQTRNYLSDTDRHRIARLEALGVVWKPRIVVREPKAWSSREVVWETRYQELVAFKNQHGHCDVPSGDLEHGPLARWLSSHRQMQRRKYLSDTHRHRIARLETLGVVWKPREGNRTILRGSNNR